MSRRKAERAAAQRRTRQELEKAEQRRRETASRELRGELAFALLGVLTLAAGRPVSAREMRYDYGLRRDTYFPPAFHQQALERGIATCLEGERWCVPTRDDDRLRLLTQRERRDLEERQGRWLGLIRANLAHELTRRVLDCWRSLARTNQAASEALDVIDREKELPGPPQMLLFEPPSPASGAALKSAESASIPRDSPT